MGQSGCRINGFTLKWIAMIAMVIDHVGAVLYPQYLILRIIGRIAFPIFCFLLVEGALHTHNIRRYEGRLLLFALISELPFDYVFYGGMTMVHQNVFFTLFLGLLMIDVLKNERNTIYSLLALIGAILLAEELSVDYGAGGILLILCFYLLRNKRVGKQVAFIILNCLYYGIGVQSYAGLAAIPMLLYQGEQGPKMKYFFYLFYPLHLLILYLIIRFC